MTTMMEFSSFSSGRTDDTHNDYDAFGTAMYNRGALLRKLREMEREDEAERAAAAAKQEQNETDGNDDTTLSYKNYLAHQSYYDDYKHVNYKYIDFGIPSIMEAANLPPNKDNDQIMMEDGEQRMIIEQDRTVGKGGFVWDAGYILAEHVTKRQDEWRRPRRQSSSASSGSSSCSVIELGSGTGITGLWVARSFPQTTQVHLTDLPELQPLLEKNSKETPNATNGVLEWGVTTTAMIKNTNTNNAYDVILGADVVASIYCAEALAQTIDQLSGPNTHVYLACRDRLEGTIENFEQRMRQIFSRVERTKAESANRNPDVWIFYATGKRSGQ